MYVLSHMFHFLLALSLTYAIFIVFSLLGYLRFSPSLFLIPIPIMVQLIITVPLAISVALLQVFFKDVKDILVNLLNVLFFLSPILYPLDQSIFGSHKWVYVIISSNPFSYLFSIYHFVFFENFVNLKYIVLLVVTFVILSYAVAFVLYSKLSKVVVEVV